ncbi:MAG: RIP metalloprotease RseP [Desulfobacteraceae bacterium]|jgi:regulator of sigma E protease
MNTFLLFIVVLGPLIFFHELGHFLVARLFGVGVEKFSLGFGPRILGKKVGRTDYRLSLIPLGGFVKMVGDEPDSDLPPEDIPYSFTHKHVAKRSLIVFAGPFFNALLAMVIFMCILYFVGISSILPVIRNIDSNSPAAQTPLELDDRIEAIDGTPVSSWRDINTILDESSGDPVKLHIIRQQETLEIELEPQKAVYTDVYGNDVPYFDFGISGVAEPHAIVGKVMKDMPAFEAGLQEGDVILSIDDRKIQYWKQMQEIITQSDGKVLRFGVKRRNESLTLEITPNLVKDRNLAGISSKNYRIGISPPDLIPDKDKVTIELTFFQSIKHSFRILIQVTGSFFDFLKNAFKGKVSRELVGGPIRIAQMAQQSAQMGLVELFSFVAAISLQLAILNLLPIPVLDGGHLLFYSIEVIKRGPLSTRARETAQQIGLFLLLLLMVFVLYNDIEFTWFN